MNKHLTKAKINKNDEFYTLYNDISMIMDKYRNYLKDKIIYCNCDNYFKSNFVKYFLDNFDKLKIKELRSTCIEDNIYYRKTRDNLYVEIMNKNGDFRNTDNILKTSDIIITNPPFSIIKEYVGKIEDKKFLILAPLTIFRKGNIIKKAFVSPYNKNKIMFLTPDEDIKSFKNIFWITNFGDRYNQYIPLTVDYDPEKHLECDNFYAINVDKVKDIPKDYYGVMCVPISFLSKHNNKQFEILSIDTSVKNCYPELLKEHKNNYHVFVKGIEKFIRVFIKRRG